MNRINKQLHRILPTILLAVGIIVAFGVFIQDNAQRITRQNSEYLDELTRQRAISVDSLIEENLTFIRSIAYLYGKSLTSPWADVAVIREYEENSVFDMLRFVDASGDNYTSKGVMSNLADRDYFQAGMRGETGITFVPESRVTGEKQVGLYAPVYFEGSVIGVMVGFYGEAFVQRLLEYELFGYEGTGWLCGPDGTVLGSTLEDPPQNYLSWLAEEGKSSPAEIARIRKAFESGTDIAFAHKEEGEEVSGYGVALTQTDWMLIRDFPRFASLQIRKNANREGVLLITEMVLMFALYVVVMLIGVLVERRKVQSANRNANDISTGVSRLFKRFITVDFSSGEYNFIGGFPTDQLLLQTDDYSQFVRALLARIPEAEQRAETAAFVDAGHLEQALTHSDQTSLRVHAPMEGDEWFTYNFIVLEREEDGQKPKRILIVSQDVTALHEREEREQKRLQNALAEAERASRAKTEFLFNMSHDLRTPMNAIIGYTELAQRDGVPEQEMRSFIRKIDSSSQHLLALINDILEMSRIESGKITLEPVQTDLVQTLEEAHEMFAVQMKEKGITFRVSAQDVKDRRVLCDQKRLNRVLLNLLSNAYKFTEPGGTVTAALEQENDLPSQGEAQENMARYILRVKDNGIGMSPEFAKKLFTPFERERTSTVSGIQGTGLGLSITRKIVDVMGGTIEAQTRQGVGTEFIVRLSFPVVPRETEADRHETNSIISGENGAKADGSKTIDPANIRLLLVEDNEINREIASMILTQSGFMLETAEDGSIALELVKNSGPGHFDLILMDIQMPVMDGYSTARAIRSLAEPELADIPIIAMTANAFAEDVQAAREAGMNGHIAKPLDVPKMLETIMQVLMANASK